MRARKAMQYAASIDDFARIMKEGNNGGYANNWLVADRKNNEIANLELGLKNVTLQRNKDGFFVGSNFPVNPKLVREETDFDLNDKSQSGTRGTSAGWADGREQGQDRRGRGRAFPGGPLRHLRQEDRAERAHLVRPRRGFPARHSGFGCNRMLPPARCRTR